VGQDRGPLVSLQWSEAPDKGESVRNLMAGEQGDSGLVVSRDGQELVKRHRGPCGVGFFSTMLVVGSLELH